MLPKKFIGNSHLWSAVSSSHDSPSHGKLYRDKGINTDVDKNM